MIKVVLDTSVFVSALLSRNPKTAPNQILEGWQQGAFSLVIYYFSSFITGRKF
jgi:predicted nucleic acid-binding protein